MLDEVLAPRTPHRGPLVAALDLDEGDNPPIGGVDRGVPVAAGASQPEDGEDVAEPAREAARTRDAAHKQRQQLGSWASPLLKDLRAS